MQLFSLFTFTLIHHFQISAGPYLSWLIFKNSLRILFPKNVMPSCQHTIIGQIPAWFLSEAFQWNIASVSLNTLFLKVPLTGLPPIFQIEAFLGVTSNMSEAAAFFVNCVYPLGHIISKSLTTVRLIIFNCTFLLSLKTDQINLVPISDSHRGLDGRNVLHCSRQHSFTSCSNYWFLSSAAQSY